MFLPTGSIPPKILDFADHQLCAVLPGRMVKLFQHIGLD
jgi:hypothetical protein